MKSRICRIWQNELYRIRSVLVFGGMGTAAPAVGTLVNSGGYNLRYGCEAAVRPPRGAWAEGQGRVGEADGRTKRALLLGLGRDTM